MRLPGYRQQWGDQQRRSVHYHGHINGKTIYNESDKRDRDIIKMNRYLTAYKENSWAWYKVHYILMYESYMLCRFMFHSSD